RTHETLAAKEPAHLNADEEREQRGERAEDDGDLERAKTERQLVGEQRALAPVDECAAHPAAHDPREEARDEDVAGNDAEVDLRQAKDGTEDRIRFAEEYAEEQQERNGDDRRANQRPRSIAGERAARGSELAVDSHEWHDGDEHV